MIKSVVVPILLFVLAFAGATLLITKYRKPAEPPYVLMVLNGRSVHTQEFSSKLKCEYALGIVKGATEGNLLTCEEK